MSRGPMQARRFDRMRHVLERRQFDLELVLDNVWDRHNVSAIVRTADAFGVGAINLLYWFEPFPRISSGVSGYAKRWTKLRRYDAAEPCFEELRWRGFRILATTVEQAESHLDVDWTVPTALVMGHERDGCSQSVLDGVDGRVSIPMVGFVQSFNVSVSAGIFLAEAARQRIQAKRYEPRWDERRQEILETWIRREETGLPREF